MGDCFQKLHGLPEETEMLFTLPTLVAVETDKLGVAGQTSLGEVRAANDEQALLLGHKQEEFRVERPRDANGMQEITHIGDGEATPRPAAWIRAIVGAPIHNDGHIIVLRKRL